MTSYEEKLKLLRDVVAMKPVDKIPVSINGPAFTARSQGVEIGDFVHDYDLAVKTDIALFEELQTADFIQTPIMNPDILSTQWLSPVAIPGEDLPNDEIWQVMEQKTVEQEDYEIILKDGFTAFYNKILNERLDNINAKVQPFIEYNPKADAILRQHDILTLNNGPCVVQPFEYFCGGRTLAEFYADDLFEEEELMIEVFDKTMEELVPMYEAQFAAGPAIGSWVGGWRSAPAMLSPDMWETFVWPYMKRLTEVVINAGVIPVFHLDSSWDRAFKYFLELPEHKCILSLDGASDIKKAREVLGDHSCLMGDVPAQMLAFGTADEVTKYVTEIIEACGPETGLIVCSGCDIPANAKKENVKAMVDAAANFK